jgi:alkanesulfonate monooxygenase SsuD/methylene tetrahydromethanopterin reductase-like flavin-dependent oxidoreductase (luciferase family)
MRFGLDIAQQRLSFAEVVARARFAEALGFDGIWGFDHFQPLYGEGPGECFEGYTTLAALATATERVRLGLLVTGLTYRPVSLLAAEAITIDHASHGRLDLSLGAAWFDKEHHELGIEFPPTGARVDLLDDSLQILRRVFTEDHVTHEGRQASVHDLTLLPRPVQSPLPIWVGASGEQRSLPLVARHADAWHCFGDVDDLSAKSQRLSAMCEDAGRDPATLLRSASLSIEDPIDAIRRRVEEWDAAGFGYLVVGWPSTGRAQVEEFASALLD